MIFLTISRNFFYYTIFYSKGASNFFFVTDHFNQMQFFLLKNFNQMHDVKPNWNEKPNTLNKNKIKMLNISKNQTAFQLGLSGFSFLSIGYQWKPKQNVNWYVYNPVCTRNKLKIQDLSSKIRWQRSCCIILMRHVTHVQCTTLSSQCNIYNNNFHAQIHT